MAWIAEAEERLNRAIAEKGASFTAAFPGTAPGFAAITGAAPTNEIAVTIARQLQEKNLYVFMACGSGGRQFADQLAEEGVQPGDYERNLLYNKNRTFAFVLALGEVTPDKYAVAAGAINYGFPVIADTDIPQILPTGVCTYEHVVSSVLYGPAFEGELIRKADTHVEFGENLTSAFEFVTSVNMDDIADGDIEIIGPDADHVEAGGTLPLAIWVEVAGSKMQPDFEPILECQIHHLVNGAEGI
jgi:acetyl-CoA synthase